MLLRLIIFLMCSFSATVFSQVIDVNGNEISVSINEAEAKSDDRFYLLNSDGKRKGYIKLEKQDEGFWLATLIKGTRPQAGNANR